MVTSLKFEATEVKHIGHSTYWRLSHILDVLYEINWFRFVKQMHREDLLQVDPSLHVVRHVHLLVQCLAAHLIAVEVTARKQHEFTLEHAQVLKEYVHTVHCLTEWQTGVNLCLSDSG